jgi:hypothetical protein
MSPAAIRAVREEIFRLWSALLRRYYSCAIMIPYAREDGGSHLVARGITGTLSIEW